MLLLEEPSSHSQLAELHLSLRRWSPTRGGVKDKLQPQEYGMHTMEETDMLATKLDLLIKCLDKHGAIKGATYGTVQSLYSHCNTLVLSIAFGTCIS